jgi:hypothetical protein
MDFSLTENAIYVTWRESIPVTWSDIEDLRKQEFYDFQVVCGEESFELFGLTVDYDWEGTSFPHLQNNVIISLTWGGTDAYQRRKIPNSNLAKDHVKDFMAMFGETLAPCTKTLSIAGKTEFDPKVFDSWTIDTLHFKSAYEISIHEFLDRKGSSIRRLELTHAHKYLFNAKEDDLCDRFPELASGLEELECDVFPWTNFHIMSSLRKLKCRSVSPDRLPPNVVELEVRYIDYDQISKFYEQGLRILRIHVFLVMGRVCSDVEKIKQLECPELQLYIDGDLVYGNKNVRLADL